MLVLWILLGILAAFLAVVFIRTLTFRPHPAPAPRGEARPFDTEEATSALRELVRCRTVSRYTAEEEDDAEFERLVALLPTLYPHVAASCPLTRVPGRALLFHWKGREAVTVLRSPMG